VYIYELADIQNYKMENANKLQEMEIDKLFGSLNSTQDFRLRLGIFLGTVNLAGVGSGVTYEKPFVIIIASFLMPIFMIADFVLLKNIYSYYYRGKKVLKSLSYDETNFFDMFMQIFDDRVRNSLQRIMSIEDENVALKELRKLPYRNQIFLGFFAPAMAFVVEFTYGIIKFMR